MVFRGVCKTAYDAPGHPRRRSWVGSPRIGYSMLYYQPGGSDLRCRSVKSAVGTDSRIVTIATLRRVTTETALVSTQGNAYNLNTSGRGAVWLARLNGVQEVAGSNPVAPTFATR